MCENWGYKALAKKKREESIEEMKHADKVIARILFLDGIPNMQRLSPVSVGEGAMDVRRLARGPAAPREGARQRALPGPANPRVN